MNKHQTIAKSEDNFFKLTPERILAAVEQAGFRCSGRSLALNSMENRVFEVEYLPEDEHLETKKKHFVIAKFYRPGRWTRQQILEEHEFLLDLEAHDIPAVAPLKLGNDSTLGLLEESGIMFAIFPKQGGRQPDELNDEQLAIVGRLLARLHRVGAAKPAKARLCLTPQTFARDNLELLLQGEFIPPEVQSGYSKVVNDIASDIEPLFTDLEFQRIHGDCHSGNLLYGEHGFYWVDFDDMLLGPPVQDLWLLLPGRDQEAKRQLQVMLEAYHQWEPFSWKTLRLIEPLRALRMIHFTTWLAKRWHDPAFPRAFPHFAEHSYWHRATAELQDQANLIKRELDAERGFWQLF